jgi:hypothetical protein
VTGPRRRVRIRRHTHIHTLQERSRPHDGRLVRKCIFCGTEFELVAA